ncbi:beta/gamma crystallin-related protein [Aerosakkonemataceae cyanobacterium BLCC-F154]|uniref:Beta/gamma crystallin-related protein n=1 Tax=Floridaenema fluviatile BLCC-F154 TaxID=3153640 RepID=A0ABV4YG70_9CYAN
MKSQHEQLFTEIEAPAFTELEDEVAATCSGGAAYLYQHDGFQGRRLTFYEGTDNLRYYNFNDETSSIKITGNKSWVFYQHINNQGKPVTLPPGEYNLYQLRQRGIQNDWISSLRRIDVPASRRLF